MPEGAFGNTESPLRCRNPSFYSTGKASGFMLPDREPPPPSPPPPPSLGVVDFPPHSSQKILESTRERVVTWLLDERLVLGMKRTRTPVIAWQSLCRGVHSIARSNGCVVECAHAVEFDGAAVCHVAT